MAEGVTPFSPPRQEGPGSRIGAYHLLEVIGEGGFGTVFLAEQQRPVKRQVAFKILKLGMDTAQVVARFELERQALAILDHAHIAKVFDAGATDAGRPYFVMEYCAGNRIDEYCDEHRLTIQERLDLFLQVCAAVQHAHTKGVIHRDLKPSNVLVSNVDGKPHAKVIDFGIAKATSKLGESSIHTERFGLVGTPEYMSPEQADGDLDIDTRTDVYSLGVVLYELLTGSTPFRGSQLRSARYADLPRILREVDPPRPSTRVSQATEAIADLAERRRVVPDRLRSALRGELDWIVMKALEKDRERRYDSAGEFALDVQRFLRHEAVVAAPPSSAYRLRKFVRRNRVIVAAGCAVVGALAVGIVAFAWQAGVARQERDVAELARGSEKEQREIADAQRDRALKAEAESEARAAELLRVSEFQSGMLAQIDSIKAGANLADDVTKRFLSSLERDDLDAATVEAKRTAFLAEFGRVNTTDVVVEVIDSTILRPALATIELDFADQPRIDAQLRAVLSDRYQSLGRFESALTLQQRALEIRRREFGESAAETLKSKLALASILTELGRFPEAEPVAVETLTLTREQLGADDPEAISALHLLAVLRVYQGNYVEAEKLAREEVERSKRVRGEDNENTILAESTRLGALMRLERMLEAEELGKTLLDRARRALGAESPITLDVQNSLGTLYQRQNRLAEAEAMFESTVTAIRRGRGENHPKYLIALGNLGFVVLAQGRIEEAEPILRESVEKRRRVLGAEHTTTLYSVSDLGHLLEMKGDPSGAEELYRDALTRRRRSLGDAHDLTRASMQQLTRLLPNLGRAGEAEQLLRDWIAALEKLEPSDPRALLLARSDLAVHDVSTGQFTAAEELIRSILPEAQRVLDPSDPQIAPLVNARMDALMGLERYSEAEAVGREVLDERRATLGDESAFTQWMFDRLAQCLFLSDKKAEAEALLREILTVRRRSFGPDHWLTLDTKRDLSDLLRSLQRYDEAITLARSELNARRRAAAFGDRSWIGALDRLAGLLVEAGKAAEAEPLLDELSKVFAKNDSASESLVAVLTRLGTTRSQLGRQAEARAALDEAIETARKLPPSAEELLVDALFQSATLRGKGADKAAARSELEEALRLAEGSVPIDSPKLAELRAALEHVDD